MLKCTEKKKSEGIPDEVILDNPSGPKPNDKCPYQGWRSRDTGEEATKTQPLRALWSTVLLQHSWGGQESGSSSDRGRDRSDVATNPGMSAATRSWERQERIPPRASGGSTALPTP